jgi:hypothetical protein
VSDVKFSPDGRNIAIISSSFGDTLELFDTETGATTVEAQRPRDRRGSDDDEPLVKRLGRGDGRPSGVGRPGDELAVAG